MPLTPELLHSMQAGTTIMRALVKITPVVGTAIRVCIGSENVMFAGESYPASPVEMSEFEHVAGLDVSNAEFRTFLSQAFTSIDLRGGHWQGAKVVLMWIDLLKPENGYIERKVGRFGQAQMSGYQVAMEYRSNTQLLGQEIGFRYARICRDTLGGIYCTKNLSAFTFTGTIGVVTNNQKFVISTSKDDKYFYRGKITFNSGENIGLSMEVQANVGTLITLFEPMPAPIVLGDTYTIIAGCDGKLSTCHNKFDNAINHFAEDSIPETVKAIKVPE